MEINLDNPIFVYYINVENTNRERASETMANIKRQMDMYNNITFWIVPCGHTKIECVYNGFLKSNKLEKIYRCLEKLIDDPTFAEFKREMREILIENIFDK